ncbi:MAG: zinc ABC transporter substrate-binding protein [Ruminococcaceae bacterium]|nr:zinc ABC transporter substrate-binding protein [Oscillospiraceae bacterium]
MKIKAIILTLIIMCCTLFCGCSNTNNKESSKIKIVTTSFSAYDWTRNILGDELNDTELTLLSDNGVDMHSYQPTADDIINIQSSDLIIVVGGSSDEWVLKSVKNAKKNIKIINMLDLLGENVLYNNESNHEHNSHADHNHKNDDLPDEHVWLSLKNSILFSNEIFKALSEINSNSATVYQENFNAYKDRLSSLDSKYRNYFDSTNNKSIIIADRFPFRYLIADYSLHYLALFEGCSAESDATIDSILNLSKQIDSNGLNYVFIIEGSNEKTAKAVIEHTKSKTQEILVLNSLQSVTKKDIKNGLSYYSVMEENLSLIYKSLK